MSKINSSSGRISESIFSRIVDRLGGGNTGATADYKPSLPSQVDLQGAIKGLQPAQQKTQGTDPTPGRVIDRAGTPLPDPTRK